MATDLILAILHHLLVFSLAAVLAAETVLIRPGLGGPAVLRLGHIDRVYGIVAGLVHVVGFSRVYFGLKGWEFYIYNWAFWAKIGAFAAVGLLSLIPTARIIGGTRRRVSDPTFRCRKRSRAGAPLRARRRRGVRAHPDLRGGDGARHRLLTSARFTERRKLDQRRGNAVGLHRRLADVGDDAALAFGPARLADIAAVQDQPVMRMAADIPAG